MTRAPKIVDEPFFRVFLLVLINDGEGIDKVQS